MTFSRSGVGGVEAGGASGQGRGVRAGAGCGGRRSGGRGRGPPLPHQGSVPEGRAKPWAPHPAPDALGSPLKPSAGRGRATDRETMSDCRRRRLT